MICGISEEKTRWDLKLLCIFSWFFFFAWWDLWSGLEDIVSMFLVIVLVLHTLEPMQRFRNEAAAASSSNKEHKTYHHTEAHFLATSILISHLPQSTCHFQAQCDIFLPQSYTCTGCVSTVSLPLSVWDEAGGDNSLFYLLLFLLSVSLSAFQHGISQIFQSHLAQVLADLFTVHLDLYWGSPSLPRPVTPSFLMYLHCMLLLSPPLAFSFL